MSDSEFDDVFSILTKFKDLGRMGRIEGAFAMSTYRSQARRQVKYAELVSEALAARRRVISEIVQTVTAQVESEETIQRLMMKRAQLHNPTLAISAEEPKRIASPVSHYFSDKVIEEKALEAAISYAGSKSKDTFWEVWEKDIKKTLPEAVVEDVKEIAQEVVKRTQS